MRFINFRVTTFLTKERRPSCDVTSKGARRGCAPPLRCSLMSQGLKMWVKQLGYCTTVLYLALSSY